MSITVTSHFNYQQKATVPKSIVQRFTFNGSDATALVTSFGSFSWHSDGIIGSDMVIEVENASQVFNSVLDNKVNYFFKNGQFDFGYKTEAGGEDVLTIFKGTCEKITLKDTAGFLTFKNLLSNLAKKYVGSSVDSSTAVNYINYNPASMTWSVLVTYGGLSSVASTSNPDINYAAFSSWSAIFADNSILVSAHFTGESVLDVIELVQEITDSSVYAEYGNKLNFARWTNSGSRTALTDAHMGLKPIPMQTTGEFMANVVNVGINYDYATNSWAGRVTAQNTSSIGSFGSFSKNYEGTVIWHTTSATALNLAQRLAYRRSEPNISLDVETPLAFLDSSIGDEFEITTQIYSFSAERFTLKGFEIDIPEKKMLLKFDQGFGRFAGKLNNFVLDDSINGLLDQTYNGLF